MKNEVGCGSVLGDLLFIRTNEDREQKTHLFLHLEALGAFYLLMTEVVCPPHEGPHKTRGPGPCPTSPTS